MIVDAYELHAQLLARWNGANDLNEAIKESLEYGGECYQVLEKLESKVITVSEAVDQISIILDRIQVKINQ